MNTIVDIALSSQKWGLIRPDKQFSCCFGPQRPCPAGTKSCEPIVYMEAREFAAYIWGEFESGISDGKVWPQVMVTAECLDWSPSS